MYISSTLQCCARQMRRPPKSLINNDMNFFFSKQTQKCCANHELLGHVRRAAIILSQTPARRSRQYRWFFILITTVAICAMPLKSAAQVRSQPFVDGQCNAEAPCATVTVGGFRKFAAGAHSNCVHRKSGHSAKFKPQDPAKPGFIDTETRDPPFAANAREVPPRRGPAHWLSKPAPGTSTTRYGSRYLPSKPQCSPAHCGTEHPPRAVVCGRLQRVLNIAIFLRPDYQLHKAPE